MVEIDEAKEGLNILNFPWNPPSKMALTLFLDMQRPLVIECSLDIPWSPGETCIWILCSRAHLLLTCIELCIHVPSVMPAACLRV